MAGGRSRRFWLRAVAPALVLAGCGADAPSTSGEVRVVDGDTLDVDGERVRLIGINAPERGECLADAAAERLLELVADGTLVLIADRSDRDDFDRLLRFVEVDGVDVGEALVAEGLALARAYPPDTGRDDRYATAGTRARARSVGVWAPDACGPVDADAAMVHIVAIRFDADGPDVQNLNDEWVRIGNVGDAAVDLTGWVLRDESASNRYRFPDRFELAPGTEVTVRSGCGTDSPADLHWCRERSAVWNNDGDTALLLDPSGNVVDRRS